MMNYKNRISGHLWIATCLTLGMCTSDLLAQPFSPFGKRRQETRSLELTESAGPWLIMCASFVGEAGEQQARQLCDELETKYKLKPYLYRQTFDYTPSVTGLTYSKQPMLDQDGNFIGRQPAKFRAQHATKFDEIAVFVGDFPSLEHATAQRVLEQIKFMKPDSLGDSIEEIENTNQRMRTLREIQKMVSGNPELKQKGPMRAAFLTQNPLLPDEYITAPSVDKFVIELNRPVKDSLLKNPGNYTVKVATFRGESTFDLEKIEQTKRDFSFRLARNKPVENSKLVDAFAKANIVTTELRKLGVEAYEYHDRAESMVCVGSFSWWKRVNAAGVEEINPEMESLIAKFTADIETLPDKNMMVIPKELPAMKKHNISFDVQPVPMAVPKQEQRTTTVFGR